MSKLNRTAQDLSIELRLRADRAIGPWKLSADDAQWAQAGKWSHAVAIGILGAWFIAVAALTGGPVNAAMPERVPGSDSTVYIPEPLEPATYADAERTPVL